MEFTETHEWIFLDGQVATVGITDFAQKELGEIVYAELPKVGQTIHKGDDVVVLESTKAAVDIYSPLSGKIIEVNHLLKEHPEKINLSPQSDGWLYKIELHDMKELDQLMNERAYTQYIVD